MHWIRYPRGITTTKSKQSEKNEALSDSNQSQVVDTDIVVQAQTKKKKKKTNEIKTVTNPSLRAPLSPPLFPGRSCILFYGQLWLHEVCKQKQHQIYNRQIQKGKQMTVAAESCQDANPTPTSFKCYNALGGRKECVLYTWKCFPPPHHYLAMERMVG